MITSFDIDKDLWERIRVIKSSRGVTQGWVITEALRQYFDENRIVLDVENGLRSKVRQACVVRGITINQLVESALRTELESHESK